MSRSPLHRSPTNDEKVSGGGFLSVVTGGKSSSPTTSPKAGRRSTMSGLRSRNSTWANLSNLTMTRNTNRSSSSASTASTNTATSPPTPTTTRAAMTLPMTLPIPSSQPPSQQSRTAPSSPLSRPRSTSSSPSSPTPTPKTPVTSAAPVEVESQRPRALSLDPRHEHVQEVFTGSRYDPRPVLLSHHYENVDWKPVEISEDTVQSASVMAAEGGSTSSSSSSGSSSSSSSSGDEYASVWASHEHQDFYHREVSHEEVVLLFRRHGSEPGLCLVRDSSRVPGTYLLTVWDGAATVNYRIEFRLKHGRVDYLLAGKAPFRCIGEIILFINRNSQRFPARPTMYIPRLPDAVKDRLFREHFGTDA